MAGPSRAQIAQENRNLLRRWQLFRITGACVAAELAKLPWVVRVAIIGSVAAPLVKEVPRFREYRQAGVALWHECKDLDLAVWVNALGDLRQLQRARIVGIHRAATECDITFAHHQVEMFLLDASANCHLGRVCTFKQCPKDGKRECLVPRCGEHAFLKQVQDFTWRANNLAADRHLVLYDPAADPSMMPDPARFDGEAGAT
jgi:hypothetical protein